MSKKHALKARVFLRKKRRWREAGRARAGRREITLFERRQETAQTAGGCSCPRFSSVSFLRENVHMSQDSLTSGILTLWAERNRVFVPADMRERTKCVQRLLERSRQDKGGSGQ